MKNPDRKIYIAILIGFVVLVGIFFFKQLFLGKVIFCCDNLTINVPSKIFLADELKHGRFPLWNPYIFSGSPYFADINLGVLSPFNLVYLLLSPFRALTAEVAVAYVVCLLGTFLFARRIGLSKVASFYTSLVYTFSGTIASYTNNVSMLHVAVLLPLVLWGILSYLQKQSLKNFLLAPLIIALQVISGHPQITYLTLVLSAFLSLTFPGISFKNKLKYMGPMLLLGVGLSAIQWVPFLEFARLSSRIASGMSYASSGSFTPLGIFRLFLPNAIGDLSGFGAWAQNGSLLGYVGVIPLLLCLLPIKKNNLRYFFIVTSLIAFLASFGAYSPIYHFLYYVLPGLKYLRSPEQFLLIYTISIVMLSGFGLDSLTQAGYLDKLQKLLKPLLYLSFVIFIVSIIGLTMPNVLSIFVQKAASFVHLNKLTSMLPTSLVFIIRYASENLLFSAVVLIVIYIATSKFKKYKLITLIIVFTFLELYTFSSHNILSVQESAIQKSIENNVLSRYKEDNYDWRKNRIFVDPSAIRNPNGKVFPKYDFVNESLWQLTVLKPNIGMQQYSRADGYGSMIYEKYGNFINNKSHEPTGIGLSLDNMYGSLLGIKYLILSDQINTLSRYKVEATCDRVFLLINDKCENNTVNIISYEPNYLKLETEPVVDTRLVFTDVDYPGWQVLVDGKKQTLENYKEIFKSVSLKSGKHTVEFIYKPITFLIGCIISAASLLIYLILLVIYFFKRNAYETHAH